LIAHPPLLFKEGNAVGRLQFIHIFIDRAFSSRNFMGIRAIDPALLDAMRRDWDARARENAKHYVATSRKSWDDDNFFRSGAEEVRELVEKQSADICKHRSPAQMRILEIGCGAGRMTLALSRIFGRVDAVDISPEMIAQARVALRECPNVHIQMNNGADLSMFPDNSFNFAISAIVFQHIPKQAIIENYISETWRVLRPGSLFKFQLQGCPIAEKLANTWVGVGFTEKQMRKIAARSGFEITQSTGAGTQYYWLTFAKP
jgi:ubiquinone/menaquinone biosynthesis C-methylase UbiE